MIKVRKLKNGVRMVMDEIPYVQSVSMGIWVRAGARDEQPKLSGVSHFIEHMMFKGTEKRSAKDIAEDAERIAGVVEEHIKAKRKERLYSKNPLIDLGDDEEDDED